MTKNIAIIVAAGRGSRAGAGGPKQYRLLDGSPILARTCTAFLNHPQIDFVRVIIHRDDYDEYENAISTLQGHKKLLPPVTGGKERQDSVRLGLESLTDKNTPDLRVLIHDAARPFIDHTTISRIITTLDSHVGAIAGLPVFDTIKKVEILNDEPIISTTISRDALWRAQTPQGFHFKEILHAHREAAGSILTDDASVAEAAGLKVKLVNGAPDNMKVTQAEDFGMAEIILKRHRQNAKNEYNMTQENQKEYRTGQGFDVHAFEEGNTVVLCGVEIPHTQKLKGHSDADVGMHALTDAILGTIGAGDIGDHFPPSDPQWRGAPSHIFLEKACALVRERGGDITHCDITLICEVPKIGPHRGAMREKLADIMAIHVERVSVKATTTEMLGFTGRSEGIAALASATSALPLPPSK